MSRSDPPMKAAAKPPVGPIPDTAVITPTPARLTRVTGSATAPNAPRNFPSRMPVRLVGRERRRSIVPWTRSFETASKLRTIAKIEITRNDRPAIPTRTKAGSPRPGRGDGLRLARDLHGHVREPDGQVDAPVPVGIDGADRRAVHAHDRVRGVPIPVQDVEGHPVVKPVAGGGPLE